MQMRSPFLRPFTWTGFIVTGALALILMLPLLGCSVLAAEEEEEGPSNDDCIECHNPEILEKSAEELADEVEVGDKPQPKKPKPVFTFGKLSLSIDKKKYEESVHGENECISCHKDIKELPHAQRTKPADCKECHEDSIEAVQASAHGKKAGKNAPGCIGCHDVHYGKGQDAYEGQFKSEACVACHAKYNLDTVAAHEHLYEAKMHMAMGCMMCHSGEEEGVHNIADVKTKVAGCEACHQKYTILSKEKPPHVGLFARLQDWKFINDDSRKEYGYVVGAHRIRGLDLIIILVVLGPLALPIFHGGLRIITRRKGPLELPDEKVLLHPYLERLWHWAQAVCIVMLIITGIMIHWPEQFPGWFDWAVATHNWFGIAAVVCYLFWLLYNIVTKRIKHYIPKKGEIPGGMIKQAKFYGYGIFKHEPHPYAPSEENKFNPLQKIAYLKFQLLLMPLLLISGILYMYPVEFRGIINAMGGMTVLAMVHYVLGAMFAAFLVAHLYLATTGETVGENFKAIITGYGIKEEHHTEKA